MSIKNTICSLGVYLLISFGTSAVAQDNPQSRPAPFKMKYKCSVYSGPTFETIDYEGYLQTDCSGPSLPVVDGYQCAFRNDFVLPKGIIQITYDFLISRDQMRNMYKRIKFDPICLVHSAIFNTGDNTANPQADHRSESAGITGDRISPESCAMFYAFGREFELGDSLTQARNYFEHASVGGCTFKLVPDDSIEELSVYDSLY